MFTSPLQPNMRTSINIHESGQIYKVSRVNYLQFVAGEQGSIPASTHFSSCHFSPKY